jgi:hypothetical protein
VTETWGAPQVIHGIDGDLSDQYSDFAITFTQNPSDGYEGIFVVANGGYAFEEITGNWKFNDDLSEIILDSGKEMEFKLEENSLTLDFIVTNSGGRSNGLSGHFTFHLKPL